MSGELNGNVPAAEAEARVIGWRPEAEFRGDPKLWVDAETYLERGRSVMPILQANNKVLTSKLAETTSTMAELRATIAEQAESLKALTEFQASEVKRQVKEQVSRIRADLAEARKDGDTAAEVRLEEELDGAKDLLKKAEAIPTPKKEEAKPSPQVVEPWAQAFADANMDWLNKDKRRTAVFAAECTDIFETTTLRGAALLEKAKEKMEEFFSEPGNRPDKSESGSRPGGGGGGGGGGGKTFASLPAEARAHAEAETSKMVGPRKPFKDEASWKKHFTEVYLAS